jgi:hypothetical protein
MRALEGNTIRTWENDMKKAVALAATILAGSASLAFAQHTKGASTLSPGSQMHSTTAPTTKGASEFAPGDVKRDTTTGMSRGASEVSPGDKMNDLRKKK